MTLLRVSIGLLTNHKLRKMKHTKVSKSLVEEQMSLKYWVLGTETATHANGKKNPLVGWYESSTSYLKRTFTTNFPMQVQRKPNIEQQRLFVSEYNANDVLKGRGWVISSHSGNVQFRSFVNGVKQSYVNATKPEKRECSRCIYERLQKMTPPGRFLDYDKKKNMWYIISEKKALHKIRQTLREGAPAIRSEESVPKEQEATALPQVLHASPRHRDISPLMVSKFA